MWNRKELKQRGKAAFKKNYWPCVLAAFILAVLTAVITRTASGNTNAHDISMEIQNSGVSAELLTGVVFGAGSAAIIIAILIDMFVKNPLIVGSYRYFVKNSEEENPDLSLLLSAYKDGNFGKVFVTMFLKKLFLALWSMLLVVPGIIKSYSYRMVPYLVADHPEMSSMEVIHKSCEMMKGQKWRAFVLDLSFIGWAILSACTCGLVGVFYVSPYMQATNAELYKALK